MNWSYEVISKRDSKGHCYAVSLYNPMTNRIEKTCIVGDTAGLYQYKLSLKNIKAIEKLEKEEVKKNESS